MSLPTDQLALRLYAPASKGARSEAKVERILVPPRPPAPTSDDMVLVQIQAAGFNRRDEWSMVGAYPGLLFPSTMGCDAVASIHGDKSGKRYIINPTVGWTSATEAPEASFPPVSEQANEYGGKGFGILGGTRATCGQGTFQEYLWVRKQSLVPCPDHLSATQAAALPCAGVTAYRALFTKGKVSSGQNVLITGIGGGVALLALRLAVAVGANVYVTGGSQEKIQYAIKAGAKGGASYKEKDWEKQIRETLPSERKYLDVVIDSAGGGIVGSSIKSGLRDGGKIVIFGMTGGPKVEVTMREVLKNVDVLGSTMGSLEEFKKCIALVAKYKVVPDIDTTLDGLERALQGFPLLADATKRSGGKVVIKITSTADRPLPSSEPRL